MKISRGRLSYLKVIALILTLAGTGFGQKKSTWLLMYDEMGNDLNAGYSISLPGPPNSGKRLEWLWLGDSKGFVRSVLDTSENRFRLGGVGVPAQAKNRLPINDIYFHDPKYGFLLQDNVIYFTLNSGCEWKPYYPVPPKDGAKAMLNSLGFFPENPARGCVVGTYSRGNVVADSLILCKDNVTPNNLSMWPGSEEIPGHGELYHLDLFGEKYGWVVGASGTIFYTDDAGRHWTKQDSNTDASLFHVSFVDDARHGVAVGDNTTVLRTSDAGETWRQANIQLNTSQEVTLVSVKFLDSSRGWIVGHGGVILYTTDGGKNWKQQQSPTTQKLYALFVDDKYCWAVGANGTVLRYEY